MASSSRPLVVKPLRSALPSEGPSGAGLSVGSEMPGHCRLEFDRREEIRSSSAGSRNSPKRDEENTSTFQPAHDKSLVEIGSVRHRKGKSLTRGPIPEPYEGGITVEDYEGFVAFDKGEEDEEEVEVLEDEEEAEVLVDEESEVEREEVTDEDGERNGEGRVVEEERGIESEDRTAEAEEIDEEGRVDEEIDQRIEERGAQDEGEAGEGSSDESEGIIVEGLYLSGGELQALKDRVERSSEGAPDPIYFYQSKYWPSDMSG